MDQLATQNSGAVELRDYLGGLRRRFRTIALLTVGFTLIAALIAFQLTPLYKSEVMISIESQEIPESIVATTVTGYVQERITGLKNRLLTPDKLWQIAQGINLFPDKLEKGGRGAVVGAMERGIEVLPVDIKFSRPGTGQTGAATVAFIISFLADTPEKAQQGASLLADLFIKEEQRSRTQQTAEVSQFLSEQAEILRAQISKLEAKLSTFKQENVPRLPEFVDLNMRLLEQTDEKLARTEERIRALQERRVFLQAQIATTDRFSPIVGSEGQTVLAPGQRLKLLRTEYLRMSATYSPDHPDITRLRREMEVLESETGVASELVKLIKERERLRSELAGVEQRYSAEHPDVRKLRTTIGKLEASIAQASINSVPARQEEQAPPDNPPYIRLKTEMDALDINLNAEREQHAQLNQKRNELEKRLFESPLVEKEYLELSRDYQNAVNRYRETNNKLLTAQAAERLESENKSQRFLLLRNAYLPNKPDSPNRLAIVLVGFFLGVTGGVSAASVSEYLDQTVRGVRGVINVFGAPPIATIPYINNPEDLRYQRIWNRSAVAGVPVLVVIVVVMLHVFWKPVEDWWPDDPEPVTGSQPADLEMRPTDQQ